MKVLFQLFFLIILLPLPSLAMRQVDVLGTIPVSVRNANYVSNEPPLAAQRLIKLPTGSIIPNGWIKTMLELQRSGLNGHLDEISRWIDSGHTVYANLDDNEGWEEFPYWLRGFSDLAFVLHDKQLLAKVQPYIEGILKSQRADGNFGPVILRNGVQDLWPNMLVLWIMQNYYEYSSDKRVIPFMEHYFHYELSVPDNQFLEDFWEKNRGGDNLWSVVWLYNRTKDSSLLKLADKIYRNTSDWAQTSNLPSWHNVNIAEGFRTPAVYSLFHDNAQLLHASYNDFSLVRNAFGQVPGGMFGGDENCRPGFFDPRQATETCAFAEQMASDEIMMLITADPMWADNCEDVSFNSFPAAFMPDMRALRYFTAPNMVVSDARDHFPGIANKGPFFVMNPFSHRCCQHNHGFAWPYYNDFLFFASPDNGLAAFLFNSCTVHAKVADGRMVSLTETTDYPFDSRISFTVHTRTSVSFPFYVRIPSWTTDASVSLNGEPIEVVLKPNHFLCLNRKWHNGDKLIINFPMNLNFRIWKANKNSVSVNYGPLTLSLKIDERYSQIDTRKTILPDSYFKSTADTAKWRSYEIFSQSPWNYALSFDSPIKLVKKISPRDSVNPFDEASVPLVFQAKGRRIPSWKVDGQGLCAPLPLPDAIKDLREETVELIPMGAARLRISAFPTYK
jgi:hypothetical protein